MSLPVTRKSLVNNTSLTFYRNKVWDSQKPPYTSPLYLDLRQRVGVDGFSKVDVRFASYDPLSSASGNLAVAETLAYEKFRDLIHAKAETLINFAQRREAAEMMATRLMSLARFARAVRKRDPKAMASALGFDVRKASEIGLDVRKASSRGRWSLPKTTGKIWLEYHFGWEPLVKDVGACIDVLSDAPPNGTVKGRKTLTWKTDDRDASSGHVIEWTCGCRLQAEVAVSNPNMFLANQLGLTNPAIVAWDLVPFSFIADWFGTLGMWINSWTDFLGLRLVNSQTGRLAQAVDRSYFWTKPSGKPKGWYVASTITDVHVRRTLGLAKPSVIFRPRKRLSLTRAATAAALLINFLK